MHLCHLCDSVLSAAVGAKGEIIIRGEGERGESEKRRARVRLFIYQYVFLSSLTSFIDNKFMDW